VEVINKDFKVKNGLLVNEGGIFGGPVEVGAPTAPSHAATKDYVDSVISSSNSGVVVQAENPASPFNGMFWLDSEAVMLKVYLNGIWLNIALQTDIPNRMDTDGGNAMTSVWSAVFNGGMASTYLN
jgi:hypothetical protein